MPYKTLATFIHDPMAPDHALEWAIAAARQWGAHLHVACVGVDDTDPGFYYAGVQAIAIQSNLENAQLDSAAIEEKVRARLAKEDIEWDVEAVTVMANGLEPFLADHMRFFDVVVLPLPLQGASNRLDVAAFEACLFGADVAVLVIPEGIEMNGPLSRLLIAWDDGDEALAACRAALPLVTGADLTEICIIDPPLHGSDRSDPGGRLAQLLARHGAKVEIAVAARTQTDIGHQLSQHALERGADVLVMGAYGHSRLREAVIGGVTRSILRIAKVPVLMAH